MESNHYDITLPDGTVRVLPRVTSILRIINREGLNIWRAKQGFELSEQYSQETADIGKEIHKFVAQLGKEKAIASLEWELLAEEVKNGCRAYVRWQREHKFKPIQSELLVYSLKYGYAGTLDAVGWVDAKPRLVLVDWKTGSTIWEEYVLQVAAYMVALNERYKAVAETNDEVLPLPPLKAAHIVSLSRETGMPTERVVGKKELKHAFRAFLHAKGLWDYYEEKGDKHE